MERKKVQLGQDEEETGQKKLIWGLKKEYQHWVRHNLPFLLVLSCWLSCNNLNIDHFCLKIELRFPSIIDFL